jgi:hypothetical protein
MRILAKKTTRNTTVFLWYFVLFLLAGCIAGCGTWNEDTKPTVTSTTPLPNAGGVSINSPLTATFSKAMNPSTLTVTTMTVTGPGATSVLGAVTYSGLTATFTPRSSLAPNTSFTATITTGAKDINDNTLAKNYVWSFTTAIAVAVVIYPHTALINVSTNVPMTQQFTASVTGTTNLAVTWSVVGGDANGTITTNGLYTAPLTAGTYQITATSVADPTKLDTATMTVQSGNTVITVN